MKTKTLKIFLLISFVIFIGCKHKKKSIIDNNNTNNTETISIKQIQFFDSIAIIQNQTNPPSGSTVDTL